MCSRKLVAWPVFFVAFINNCMLLFWCGGWKHPRLEARIWSASRTNFLQIHFISVHGCGGLWGSVLGSLRWNTSPTKHFFFANVTAKDKPEGQAQLEGSFTVLDPAQIRQHQARFFWSSFRASPNWCNTIIWWGALKRTEFREEYFSFKILGYERCENWQVALSKDRFCSGDN